MALPNIPLQPGDIYLLQNRRFPTPVMAEVVGSIKGTTCYAVVLITASPTEPDTFAYALRSELASFLMTPAEAWIIKKRRLRKGATTLAELTARQDLSVRKPRRSAGLPSDLPCVHSLS